MNNNPNTHYAESQKAQILEDLLEGKKVTALDGLQRYGCLNVRNRIGELRREDCFEVQSKWIRVESGKMVKEYFL